MDVLEYAASQLRAPLEVAEAPAGLFWSADPHSSVDVSADELRSIALSVCGDPVDANRLVHAIVPKSSLNRRGKLTQAQGEQALRMRRLFAKAGLAFQDDGDARAFMRNPHPMLGRRPPLDAAMTEMGGRAVERILDGLLYGLPI